MEIIFGGKMKFVDSFCFLLIALISLHFPIGCHSDEHAVCSLINLDDISEDMQCIRFTTTFESFFLLVDEEYWMRTSRQSKFQENISLSMYRYYMAQHLYARLVEIRAARGLVSTDEEIFSRHVKSAAPVVPLAIITYLDSIGDVKIRGNDGHYNKFFHYHSIIWPNSDGDFGRVSSNNHWMYMSFPAPAVVSQAVQEDLVMEINVGTDWDLKRHLSPSIHEGNAGLPTANLLGWKPATVLTLAQRQNLHLSGINQYHFEVINLQFQFNSKLMKIIYKYLEAHPQATGDLRIRTVSEVNFGATEQLGWAQRQGQAEDPVSRTFASVERNMQAMVHAVQPKTGASRKISQIFGFRVDKRNTTDWAIHSWNDYRDVPGSWNVTKNSVFEFGDIGDFAVDSTAFLDSRDGDRAQFLENFF